MMRSGGLRATPKGLQELKASKGSTRCEKEHLCLMFVRIQISVLLSVQSLCQRKSIVHTGYKSKAHHDAPTARLQGDSSAN